MIKNYFKVALRYLLKNRLQSFINITGLSVGMAVAMLIGFWIWDELSFDRDNEHYDRITQVMQHLTHNGETQTWSTVPYPLAMELRKNYGSDFKYVVLGRSQEDHILSTGDKNLSASGSYFEPEITRMLSMKMVQGDIDGLKDPLSILLSETTAKAIFADANPVGRLLKIDDKLDVKVAGVYKDFPENSSFSRMAYLASWQLFYNNSWIKTTDEPWRPNPFTIYAQLNEGVDLDRVSAKIKDLKLKNINKKLAAHKPELFLYPMARWHLYSEFKNGRNIGGRIQYLWLFGIIGGFVLLLACINFMNLSTARSEKRAKEVGIRKSIGSLRSQLIAQFFLESLLITLFAWGLSLVWVQTSLPFFNRLAEKQIAIPWGTSGFWITSLIFCLITGLVAGSYPVLYLSSFQPVRVLKGVFRVGKWAVIPRKVLVVVQFTVSVVLIVGTLVVFRQIQYARDRPAGYDRDGLLIMKMLQGETNGHLDAFEKDLKASGVITALGGSESPTTAVYSSNSGLEWKGKDPNLAINIATNNIFYDYGRTIGWQISEGRDFSRDFPTDSSGMILNEAAVKFMGLQHPLGEIVRWDGYPFTVIGVVKDLIMESPYSQVLPAVFTLSSNPPSFLLARINPSVSPHVAVEKIGEVFRKYSPAQPFEYKFVDEEYERKFGNEERIGRLAGVFSALAIFISCMGLFGMAAFMADQRIKEIGVRKVLGASVLSLWQILTKEFLWLVIISLLIAAPIGWCCMFYWLRHYQYHAAVEWWIFLVAGACALGATLFTVSYQAIRIARANPIEALRTE